MADSPKISRPATIGHESGLHLRPIQQVVRAATDHEAEVTIHFNDKAASAKSAMELMLLGAISGARLTVEGSGKDAEEAVQSVVEAIENEAN